MSRDKQMFNDLIEIFDEEYGKRNLITPQNTVKKLIEKGYCKFQDAAEEIFEEIKKKVKASLTIHLEEINKEHIKDLLSYDWCSGVIFALRQIEGFLAELEKKYTEEGK